VDVGVPGGKRGNVQTGGGDRVITISLLGFSTSVTLATGPTDEEEDDEEVPYYEVTYNTKYDFKILGICMYLCRC